MEISVEVKEEKRTKGGEVIRPRRKDNNDPLPNALYTNKIRPHICS